MSNEMKTHKDLNVWKKAMDLVVFVYQATSPFPDSERFGLTNQIRRSVVSIPSNIAEGAARTSDKEFLHFLSIALGSLAELETQLIIANRLKYISDTILETCDIELTSIRKMILGLKKSLKK